MVVDGSSHEAHLTTFSSATEPTGQDGCLHWLLTYELVDDYLERRTPLRPEHLALAEDAHRRGELVMAGALGEPTDRAMLVFRADDRGTAEAFAAADPYVVNGLAERWEVRPWTVVVGA
jgi:uncharacterized protein YciI